MKLVIAGAGGHGRVVAEIAALTGWREISFLDDRFPQLEVSGVWPVIGKLAELASLRHRFDACAAAFGNAGLRLQVLEQARIAGFACPSLVHPAAVVSAHATLAPGTVVAAGSVVGTFACTGVGCIVNTGATVDHDCHLADGVHICPGAHLGGDVRIGARTWFGIGAVAIQGIRIGEDVTVGAGAVCVSDVRDGVLVVGVPAAEKQS